MCVFFFFKQKTAYEMRISDWSSDVCSSDLDQGRQKAIKDELEWIRQSPKARQAKSKARIKSFDQLVEAQEKRTPGKAQIVIQIPERLGGKVIEVAGISKAYGDKLLFEDLSFTLPPGGIVGVIGPNGAGKSTLFKLITGQETIGRASCRERVCQYV